MLPCAEAGTASQGSPCAYTTALLDLPDTLLLAIAQRVSVKRPRSLRHNLICRKFSEFGREAHVHLCIGHRHTSTKGDQSLPDFLASFPELSRLRIFRASFSPAHPNQLGTRLLTQIFGTCRSLKALKLEVLEVDIPPCITLLTSLKKLELRVSACSLPDNIGDLRSLHTFTLRETVLSSRPLLRLPPSITSLSSLRALTLVIPKLESLPRDLGKLSALTSLHVGGELSQLPCSLTELTNLKELQLFCHNLQVLPRALEKLFVLERVNIQGCIQLKRFPSFLFSLSRLRDLEIGSLTVSTRQDAEEEDVGEQDLEQQDFKEEAFEEQRFEVLRNLPSLRALRYHSWSGKLPDTLSTLQQLTSLALLWCAHAELPPGITKLSNLKSLELLNMHSLLALPSTLGNLSQLTGLVVSGCSELKTINPVTELRSLVRLQIGDCQSLHEFPLNLVPSSANLRSNCVPSSSSFSLLWA